MSELETLRSALAGRFALDREIGRGGMATVYLATDEKHNRRVAVKVLNPALAGMIGAERFLSEIRVAATLQHPNLLPLFDSGDAEGTLYYIMPFVEGESLRVRIQREKQLPLDESIRIVATVAAALEHAHRHGVIHRDLKPENILLHEGEPLVADFGIALAISNAGGTRLTETGLSLGTPQYMAPEQATGERQIDARADVYALGAILYEMLAGEAPFTGATSQVVIAKLLTETPRGVRSARPSVPPQVEAAIARALAKAPADRWPSAKDFATALNAPAALGMASSQPTRFPRRRPRGLPWILAATTIAVVAASALWRRDDSTRNRAYAFTIRLPDTATVTTGTGTSGGDITISRDAGTIAYVAGVASGGNADRGVWTRALDQLEAQPVRGLEHASAPRFSPDGRTLLYNEGNGLFVTPASGGHATRLADNASSHDWIDSHSVIFTRNGAFWPTLQSGAELWVTSIDSPSPRLAVRRDTARRILAVELPSVLPGGRDALITIRKGEPGDTQRELAVASLSDGAITELGVPGSNARYALGNIVFVKNDGGLYAAPFSISRRSITGPVTQLASQVVVGVNGGADFDVADDGTIVYVAGSEARRRLTLVDRSGRGTPVSGDVRRFFTPRVSPDGALIGVEVNNAQGFDIWIYDRTSRTLSAATSDHHSIRPAGWLNGHSEVAFVHVADPNRPWDLSSTRVDGSGPRRVLAHPTSSVVDGSVGQAGIAFRTRDGSVNLATTEQAGAARLVIASTEHAAALALSRNGIIAYVSAVGGTPEVYARPTSGDASRVQVSSGGGAEPVWSPTSNEVFYRAGEYLMSATLSRNPLRVIRRDTLFRDDYMRGDVTTNYDVLPDGKGFVMIQKESPDVYPTVLLNHLRRP